MRISHKKPFVFIRKSAFLATIISLLTALILAFGVVILVAYGEELPLPSPLNTLAFLPASLRVAEPTVIPIQLQSDGVLINAVQAEISFDQAVLEVLDFEIDSILCEERFKIDDIIDNETGRAHVSCGTLTPYGGTSTIFATLSILPLSRGTTTITFGTSTSAHAHDGFGTQIIDSYASSTFFIE